MKFGYADPPYIGQAKKHYKCAEVDHKELVMRLVNDYPDGWALSCSSPSLGYILSLCPPNVRVAAWVKPFSIFKPGVNPAYTWEPVVFMGGRKGDRTRKTVKDHLIENITLKKGLVGAKPEKFCMWLLDLLGYQEEDVIDDLFPGTGVMGRVLAKLKEVER